MAEQFVQLNPGADGALISTDSVSGGLIQRIKQAFGSPGEAKDVSLVNPFPVANRDDEIAYGNVPGMRFRTVFGANPNVGTSTVDTITDIGGTYVAPLVEVLHDIESTHSNDEGTLVASGTATSGSINTLVDTSAPFGSVAVGDSVINDDAVELGRITAVTSTTLTFASGMREPDRGFVGTPITAGVNYRVITSGSDGAGFVYIKGLDGPRATIDEFVLMADTAPVSTVNLYARINLMRSFGKIVSTGTTGVITAKIAGGGTTTAQINNGNNQSLTTVQTVALGDTALIKQVNVGIFKGGSVARANVILRAGFLGGFGYVLHEYPINTEGTSLHSDVVIPPLYVSGGVDVWMESDSSAVNTRITGGYSMTIRRDSFFL